MWKETERLTVGPPGTNENHSVTVTTERRDDRMGYEEYRVGAIWGLAQKCHTRKRTFKGETAHMDADRHFGDIVSKVRYG